MLSAEASSGDPGLQRHRGALFLLCMMSKAIMGILSFLCVSFSVFKLFCVQAGIRSAYLQHTVAMCSKPQALCDTVIANGIAICGIIASCSHLTCTQAVFGAS